MNGRDAYRMALSMEQKKTRKKTKASDEARKIQPRGGGRDESYHSENHIEDNIARALDHRRSLQKNAHLLERLDQTKDVQGFFQDVSPSMASNMLLIAEDEEIPAKVRLEAIKDILDRAGHGKVTKHAVARFDASDSRDKIISTILGNSKELKKMGIEIVDDDEDQEK